MIPCPNCGEKVVQVSAPQRGPANDSSEMWLCLKCPATVCVHCYHEHTAQEHPDMYQEQSAKTKKGKRK